MKVYGRRGLEICKTEYKKSLIVSGLEIFDILDRKSQNNVVLARVQKTKPKSPIGNSWQKKWRSIGPISPTFREFF